MGKASAASEHEAIPQEVLADEEPRYLRRQKPVEVRRRKFGKRTWPAYRRILVAGAILLVAGFVLYEVGDFFLFSPRVTLQSLDQIDVTGSRYVARQTIVEKFSRDVGKSIMRIPLDTRSLNLETIPWVERAVVSRIMPNHIRVELVERVPVAFLRTGTDVSLIDAQGVILERPLEGDFRFPVLSGVSESVPAAQRAIRMGYYTSLLRGMNQVKPGATDHVSEVDLSDASDVRATLAGLDQMGIAGLDDQGALLVHFGNKDFESKFRVLVENIAQWRATAGRVDSVDLRFSKQVVVNPESRATATSAGGNARPVKSR
jgi:cell division protein FtsQ